LGKAQRGLAGLLPCKVFAEAKRLQRSLFSPGFCEAFSVNALPQQRVVAEAKRLLALPVFPRLFAEAKRLLANGL